MFDAQLLRARDTFMPTPGDEVYQRHPMIPTAWIYDVVVVEVGDQCRYVAVRHLQAPPSATTEYFGDHPLSRGRLDDLVLRPSTKRRRASNALYDPERGMWMGEKLTRRRMWTSRTARAWRVLRGKPAR